MEHSIIKKIVATPELLSEMEALEIRGGIRTNEDDIYALGTCQVNSGNCVPGCACKFEQDRPGLD